MRILLILILQISFTVLCSCGITQLTQEILRACVDFGTRFDQAKWRLICRRMNMEVILMTEDKTRKIRFCMNFVQNINNPHQFDNETAIEELKNCVQCIKLNQDYLKFLPRTLYNCCDDFLNVDKHSMESVNVSSKNLNRLFRVLFETPLYRQPSPLESLLPNNTLIHFFPFLGGVSRKIMNRALEKPSKFVLAILDCFCYVYGFMWNYIARYHAFMPDLDEVYYLEANMEIPFKKQQLLFLQEFIDKFGLIPYHHKFINQQWAHTDIMTYVQFLLGARADIGNDAFTDDLTAHFMIKLLDGHHYDLSKFQLPAFIGFIDHSITYLFNKQDNIHLHALIRNLKVNNGLVLIRNSNGIVARTLYIFSNHQQLSHQRMRCLSFFEILISANSKYLLQEYQISLIAASLSCWFVSGKKETAVLQMMNFIYDRFFNDNLLVELVNIHDSFCFGDTHSEYFVAVIAELWKHRDEWKKDTPLFVFVMTFQNELMAKGLKINCINAR